MILVFLVVTSLLLTRFLLPVAVTIPCKDNAQCDSLCCVKKIYNPLASGECERRRFRGEPCLPHQKRIRVYGKRFYLTSCPCNVDLDCVPEYTKRKDQTYLVVNPKCQFPPPTTEATTATITTTAAPSTTTPCVSKGPLVVNLSISIPLP